MHGILVDNIILTQNHAWHITQSGWNNYLVLATIKGPTPFCLGMHSNVTLRFMVQALQDHLKKTWMRSRIFSSFKL